MRIQFETDHAGNMVERATMIAALQVKFIASGGDVPRREGAWPVARGNVAHSALGLAVVLSVFVTSTRYVRADPPPSHAEIESLVAHVVVSECEIYTQARNEVLGLGILALPALEGIARSEGASWQERLVARTLIATIRYPSSVLSSRGILATGVLPTQFRPVKAEWKNGIRYNGLPDEAFISQDSVEYRTRLGVHLFVGSTSADLACEAVWKGDIEAPSVRRAILGRMGSSHPLNDHEMITGVALEVLDRADEFEESRLAVMAITGHVGPARQEGWPVRDSEAVLAKLAGMVDNPDTETRLRETILGELGETQHPWAVGPVVKYLGDTDVGLQAAAVTGGRRLLFSSYPNPDIDRVVEGMGRLLVSPDISEGLAKDLVHALSLTNTRSYPEAALKAADLLERYAERDDVPEALREKARQRAKVLTARLSGKPLAELDGPITTRPVYTKQEFEISPTSQPASRPSTTTGPAD